jgi:hypothetical protein
MREGSRWSCGWSTARWRRTSALTSSGGSIGGALFREEDDHIYGGGSATDLPIGFVYSPSDNANLPPEGAPEGSVPTPKDPRGFRPAGSAPGVVHVGNASSPVGNGDHLGGRVVRHLPDRALLGTRERWLRLHALQYRKGHRAHQVVALYPLDLPGFAVHGRRAAAGEAMLQAHYLAAVVRLAAQAFHERRGEHVGAGWGRERRDSSPR